MSKELLISCFLVVAFCLPAWAGLPSGSKMRAFQMKEDFGAEPLSQCYLQYYYYIPCPTFSWFWAFTGPTPGETMGAFFEIGEISTGTGTACDPEACHTLETVRVIDFAGYGTAYPGLFSVVMDVYCADENGCPIGPPLWTSGTLEFHFGWNYVAVDPALCLTYCITTPGPPVTVPRVLVTFTHTGVSGVYPAWGFDNISTPLELSCVMHDISCMPAQYPRPYVGNYPVMHSGYCGYGVQYCPPIVIHDGRDTTPDGSQFGSIELAWRIYVSCTGPTPTLPSSWGNIKSMYR
jgi:hypothetical protein